MLIRQHYIQMIRTSLTLWMMIATGIVYSQGIKVTDVLIISHPELKQDVDPKTFQSFVTDELFPELTKKSAGTSYHLFKADRGNEKGKFLLVSAIEKSKAGKPSSSGSMVDPKRGSIEGLEVLVSNPQAYSEYHLIGADKIRSLPTSGILGLHYIKVKKERSGDFEKFVVDKLHPAVSKLFPDMQMFYYKSVAGENSGSYLTIFTIDSPNARHKYWPEGAPETDLLKKTFKPLEGLAKELGTYLVEGSYLEPSSGGAAAYWESKVWTDFVHSRFMQ